MLDRAGVGVGGDGFVAEEISCLVDLGRQPKPGAFTVDYCTILSGAASLGSTSRLVSQLASLYGKLLGARPDARCVTFENASRWSGYVAQLFFSTLAHNDVPTFSWLESVEQGARHYMTARPALDLIANEAFAHERPLLLSALGAGGRIGVLMLVPQHYESVQDLPIGLSHDFGQAEIVTHGHMEDIVHYVQKKYYGRTNFYFKWGIANVVGRVETEDFEYTAPLSSALP